MSTNTNAAMKPVIVFTKVLFLCHVAQCTTLLNHAADNDFTSIGRGFRFKRTLHDHVALTHAPDNPCMDHAKTPEESDILPYPVTASRLQVESQNLAITHKSKASAIDERGFIIGYPVNTTPESPA